MKTWTASKPEKSPGYWHVNDSELHDKGSIAVCYGEHAEEHAKQIAKVPQMLIALEASAKCLEDLIAAKKYNKWVIQDFTEDTRELINEILKKE